MINGERKAATALELMRSRYSAFSTGNGAYVVRTTCRKNRNPEDAGVIEGLAGRTEWIKLQIIAHSEKAQSGEVEFRAYFREGEAVMVHHEKSRFVREEGEWAYVDGTVSVESPGRNEACPCGSGKKYKRCCAI